MPDDAPVAKAKAFWDLCLELLTWTSSMPDATPVADLEVSRDLTVHLDPAQYLAPLRPRSRHDQRHNQLSRPFRSGQ